VFGALEVVREPHFEKPRVTPMLGFTEFEAQKKSGDNEPHFEKPRVTPMLGFTEFEAQKKSGDKSWWNTHVTIRETSNRH